MKVDRGRPAVRAKLVDFVLVAAAGILVIVIVGFLGVRRVLQRAGRPLHRVGWHRDAVRPAPARRSPAPRDRDHRPAPLPLCPGTPDPPPRSHRGGILTAVGVWGATKLLAIVFSDFSRYNLIYGSLAGVMTFLFFVYVVAFILLLGAEFAYAWSQPPGPPGPPLRTRVLGACARPLRPPRRPARSRLA